MSDNPLQPTPAPKRPGPVTEFDLKLCPKYLLCWLLAVGLGAWGGGLLHQQATPFPTRPPSVVCLVLLALGFAAFFLCPETDLEG